MQWGTESAETRRSTTPPTSMPPVTTRIVRCTTRWMLQSPPDENRTATGRNAREGVVGSQYQAQHRATGQATGREGKKMKKENIMESYIRYKVDDEVFTNNMTGCDLDQVLNSASKMYAFDDCTYIKVLEVVHDGKHYEYDGWEPGMTFTFRDEAGEIAWSRSFPHWDH